MFQETTLKVIVFTCLYVKVKPFNPPVDTLLSLYPPSETSDGDNDKRLRDWSEVAKGLVWTDGRYPYRYRRRRCRVRSTRQERGPTHHTNLRRTGRLNPSGPTLGTTPWRRSRIGELETVGDILTLCRVGVPQRLPIYVLSTGPTSVLNTGDGGKRREDETRTPLTGRDGRKVQMKDQTQSEVRRGTDHPLSFVMC